MRVCLVGVGWVGKTTIGRLLAGRLGVPFFDLDEELERHFATSIERLQARQGTECSDRGETAEVLPARRPARGHRWPGRRGQRSTDPGAARRLP